MGEVLSTTTNTKASVFSLRDLVTRHTRAIGLEEREELYDTLAGLGERYTFGFEGSDEDDDFGSGED